MNTGAARPNTPIDPPGIPATGKQIDFDGVDIHEYRDGKITKLGIIVNMNDIAIHLGTLADMQLHRNIAAALRDVIV